MAKNQNTPVQPKQVYEFWTCQPDNRLEVQITSTDEVHIVMAADNFTLQRKAYFVRELAAEGFISDHFAYLSENEFLGVHWHVSEDGRLFHQHFLPQSRSKGRKFLTFCFAVWMIFMFILLLGLFR